MAYQSPAEGQRINIKSNSNSVIDRSTVILQEGAGISLSQASSTITINRSSIDTMDVHMSNDQTTNLAANDHVKFNTVLNSVGSSISLDTSTTYTNGAGASIGRFTLAANKTYMLYGNLIGTAYSATSGYIYFQWYNVTAGVMIGHLAYNSAPGRYTSQNILQTQALAIISTTASTLVELRFYATNAVSQIGITGFGIIGATASLQVIS